METLNLEKLDHAVTEARVRELKRQNSTLHSQLSECQAFIGQFPRRIASARLDATSGRQTSYDYDTHGKCLETRVPASNAEVVRVLAASTDLRAGIVAEMQSFGGLIPENFRRGVIEALVAFEDDAKAVLKTIN